MEHKPDSVLALLDSVDPSTLITTRSKADYTLLKTMALDGKYGSVRLVGEESLKESTAYFEKRGPKTKSAIAWYYLGRCQYEKGDYNSAVLSFIHGQSATMDNYRLGLLYREMGRTYNACQNTVDEIIYMRKAAEYFERCGDVKRSAEALLGCGIAYYNMGDYKSAEDIYKSVFNIARNNRDTLLEVRTLQSYSAICLAKNEQDPSLCIYMIARMNNNLHYPPSAIDLSNLAYAYSLLSRNDLASKWIEEAKATSETASERHSIRFREYQILARSGDTIGALKALEEVMEYNTLQESTAVLNNTLASQRDYFESQSRAVREQLRSARLRLIILLLFLFIGIVIAYNYYRLQRLEVQRRLIEEKNETDRVMSLAEDLKSRVQELQSRSQGNISNYFTVLERLCEQYYVYEGTENLQPKVLGEVRKIISGMRNDTSEIEAVLNSNRGNLMKDFRAAFPTLKDEDVRLFCYCAAGLSTATISTLMEKEKQYIYNRVYRLKGRISSSDVNGKERFLSAMSG